MKADLKTIQSLNNPTIKKCPYCGSDIFFYKQSVSGKCIMHARYDGEETENGGMHDNLTYTEIGKFAYCFDCGKRVFRFKE